MKIKLVHKLIEFIFISWGLVSICFILLYIVPGDPIYTLIGQRATPETIQQMKQELGLDQPIYQQYMMYLNQLFHGNLGYSYSNHTAISKNILARMPTTFLLALSSISISTMLGLLLGLTAAIYHKKMTEKLILNISSLGISVPVFWAGVLSLYFISKINPKFLCLFPNSYSLHFLLASVTLGIRPTCLLARVIWSQMIKVLEQDFIISAKSRNISPLKILFYYGLNSVKIPIITLIMVDLGSFLTGAAITESIFALPGVGKYTLDGILKRDQPVIMGCVLFMAFIFIFINWSLEFLYPILDPRVKNHEK